MIPVLKRLYTIESVVESAGIRIVKGKALCPFHHDTEPSMSFKYDRFKCWSCDTSGDIIDFIEKFYGVSTGEAIKTLAVKAGLATSPTPRQISTIQKERKERNARIKAFRVWEQDQVNDLSYILRTFRSFQLTEEIIDIYLPLILRLDEIEYKYEIICGSNDDLKLALYREAMQKWK